MVLFLAFIYYELILFPIKENFKGAIAGIRTFEDNRTADI